MNKKFSTLMAGFLLTSAFASAQVTLDPANLKIAEKVEPGKEYLVIQSADNKIDGEDRVLSVVADEEGNLTYKAYKLNSYDGEKTETATSEKSNLLWVLGEAKIGLGTTKSYYTLKNSEAGSYLSFDKSKNLIKTVADSKDALNGVGTDGKAKNVYSYFINAVTADKSSILKQGDYLYSENGVYSAHQLQFGSKALVSLNGQDDDAKLYFCVYNTIEADLDDIIEMNKTMGGEGFNLNFTNDKLKDCEENVIYEQKFKAFYVKNELEVDLGDKGVTHVIPAGFYLATSYPETLIGTAEIKDAKDFLACSFLAVSPTENDKINGLAPKDGKGFKLAIVKAEDMNYVEDFDLDQAAVKGQTYVGNACFTIEIPDFANNEEAYQFKAKDIRVWVDGELAKADDMYISSVTSEGKSRVVTNDSGVTFETDNSSILNPKKLLSTEDRPSIFTIQFVSGENKEENSEYGQYLTVGNQTASGKFTFFSTTDENVGSDPLYQFVIADIDTVKHTITFANRQTKKMLTASLYTEDADNMIYTIYAENVKYQQENVTDKSNEKVKFDSKALSVKKIQLAPVTVEDKFATFNAAESINGLVRFELARTSEADAKFFVYAPRKKKANGDVVLNPGAGNVMVVTEDVADQFELVKVLKANGKPDTQYSELSYVFNKDGKKYTSLKRDTVAYDTYNIKLFAPEEAEAYYINGTSLIKGQATNENATFVIKTNLDGSVSLIYDNDLKNDANYLEFADAKKEKEDAWASGNYYNFGETFNKVKTFMVAEPEAISLEAKPQHLSIEAVRGGFISMNANKDGILAMNNTDTEAMTLWVDTVKSDEAVPSFYIAKGGNFLYFAKDSAESSLVNKDSYKLEDKNYKLIFKAAELVSSDTLKTVVDGKEALVAAKANAGKKIKGGLGNFQYQIIKDEEGSDEYVIRLTDVYNYVRVINNMLTLDADKKKAARFTIESQEAPTANEGVAVSEVKVLAGEGNVTIAGAAGKKVVISNILGQVVANTVISSDNATIAAPAGVVVVAVEGEAAVKAIVK